MCDNYQIWLEARRWKPEIDILLASDSRLGTTRFAETETLRCIVLITNDTNNYVQI